MKKYKKAKFEIETDPIFNRTNALADYKFAKQFLGNKNFRIFMHSHISTSGRTYWTITVGGKKADELMYAISVRRECSVIPHGTPDVFVYLQTEAEKKLTWLSMNNKLDRYSQFR